MTHYNYLDQWYHVIYKHKSANVPVKKLSFRLIDSALTRLWLETVQETIADPKFKVYYNQTSTLAPTLSNINAVWDKMYQTVQETNSKQWIDVDQISMPMQFDPKTNPQPILNQLHYEFHRFEEAVVEQRWRVIDAAYDPLQIMNVLIHQLENITQAWFSNNGTNNTPMISTFFIHRTNPVDGNPVLSLRPITEDLHQHWNSGDVDGVLQLGYHTIGKNLFHCYIDNDTTLVKSGMLRPQVNLGTEAQVCFSKYKYADQQRHVAAMHQWVRDNQLEQYVDLTKSQNSLVQQPVLGKIQNSLTTVEIIDLFENYQIETVELEVMPLQ